MKKVIQTSAAIRRIEINSSLVDDWIDFCDVRQSTEKTYRKALKQFQKFLSTNNIVECSQLTRNVIKSYKVFLQKYESGTGRLYFVAAKIFLQFLSLKGFIDGKIIERIKSPVATTEHTRAALTRDELITLFDACTADSEKNLRDKIALSLMACLGLRTCELCRLNRGDFEKRNGKFFLKVIGKGRDCKESMPLPVEIAAMLIEYLNLRVKRSGKISNESALFVATSNRNCDERLQEQTFSRMAKAKMRKIGIDSQYLCAHSLRHSFACISLEKTKNIRQVMRAMRHKSQLVTERYLHDKEYHSCSNLVVEELFRKELSFYG